ncbi:MAG: hypothetical protein QF541_23225, partial [Lentisphaeria bacterium]|nr:hypothetical protein [Lentisphaeria bacterium]
MLQSLDKRIRIAAVLPVFLLSTYCQAVGGAPSARRLVATRGDTPPVIDGKLEDACWQEAAQATGFSVFTNPDQMHPEPTQGRVCFDDDNIYILCCSMMSCVVCNDLKEKNPNITLLDIGSGFDPIFGVKT